MPVEGQPNHPAARPRSLAAAWASLYLPAALGRFGARIRSFLINGFRGGLFAMS